MKKGRPIWTPLLCLRSVKWRVLRATTTVDALASFARAGLAVAVRAFAGFAAARFLGRDFSRRAASADLGGRRQHDLGGRIAAAVAALAIATGAGLAIAIGALAVRAAARLLARCFAGGCGPKRGSENETEHYEQSNKNVFHGLAFILERVFRK
jgi:hypothetical protein